MNKKMEDFAYWEERGETYTQLDDVSSSRTAYKIVNFIKSLGLNLDSWILDAGCGSGNITKVIRDNFRHSNIIGIDLSKIMIGNAKIKERKGLKFFSTDFFDFAKDLNQFFDLTIASLFLHHLTEGRDAAAVDEIYRILNPHGSILIAEAIPPSENIFEYYKQIFSIKESRNCYTLPDLLKLVRGAGFEDVRFMTYRFDIRLLSWLNDNTLTKEKRNLLYSMHVSASSEFKKAYAMEELLNGDYRLRCRMCLVTGRKV